MKIGTRSVLFGAHQFLLHPLFVAWGWVRCHGWRDMWRWQLWLCFVVHDWGYWGKGDLDGEDGEMHPDLGARIVWHLAGPLWAAFCAGHSRGYARRVGIATSKLMRPDKQATYLMPRWLYVLLIALGGEWVEWRDLWIAAGGYPGAIDDGPWAYSGHIRDNWRRFESADAEAGYAFGGE